MPKKDNIQNMFDSIAPEYDKLNHIMSLDIDKTWRKRALKYIFKPDRAERAMAAGGRFGGHIVSGHIDGTGTIANMEREENAVWVTIETTPQIMKYIIEKGSIAIDGISLTVATVSTGRFQVSIILHTGQETTLLTKKPGDIVNLENDVIGKYVEHLLHFKEPENKKQSSKVDMGFLAEHGFL